MAMAEDGAKSAGRVHSLGEGTPLEEGSLLEEGTFLEEGTLLEEGTPLQEASSPKMARRAGVILIVKYKSLIGNSKI